MGHVPSSDSHVGPSQSPEIATSPRGLPARGHGARASPSPHGAVPGLHRCDPNTEPFANPNPPPRRDVFQRLCRVSQLKCEPSAVSAHVPPQAGDPHTPRPTRLSAVGQQQQLTSSNHGSSGSAELRPARAAAQGSDPAWPTTAGPSLPNAWLGTKSHGGQNPRTGILVESNFSDNL